MVNYSLKIKSCTLNLKNRTLPVLERNFNLGTKDGSEMGSDEEIGQFRITFGISTTTTMEPASEKQLRRNLERERKRNT